jgi:hypothetical protein
LFSSFSKEWRAARDEYKTVAKNDDVKNAKALMLPPKNVSVS